MWLPIIVFAGSAALVGGMTSLARGKPTLAKMLAAPRPDAGEIAQAEGMECQRHLIWSAVVMGTVLTGRYLTPLPLALAITPLAAYLQWPWLKAAWSDLTERRTVKVNGLTAIALTGGWIAGFYIGSAFALFAYLLSRRINLLGCVLSRQKLSRLYGQQPQTLWLLVDGAEIETPFHEIQAGDIVVIYAGEPIPADGTIVAGEASVDQRGLTGETDSVERSVGDSVFANTLVQRGWLHVRVDRLGEKTVAMQLADIINHTTLYPLPTGRRGQTLAEDYAMPIAVLGIATLPLLGANSALAVLLARPGVDMNDAAPLALENYIYLCAKHGILVKDGRALELMRTVDTVVFDLTGSLTLEQPEVFSIHTCGDLKNWQVLAIAAAAGQLQSHPIAKAIVEEAKQCRLKLPEAIRIFCESGFGVQASIGGQRVHVGSLRFIGDGWLTLPPELEKVQAQCAELGHFLVFVAVEDTLVGALELRPALRPEAMEVVAELKWRNLKVAILSDDRIEPTRQIAQRLGIEEYLADMLPEDKVRHLEHLKREGHSVCFLGDSDTDGIALQSTHVSVSVQGFARAAQEPAQIVLMGQSLLQLPLFFDLSRQLDSNQDTSFMLSVATGVGIIGGVFLFHAGIAAMAALNLIGNLAITSNTMLPLLNPVKRAVKTAGPTLSTPARWIEP